MTDPVTDYQPSALPEVVVAYLDARDDQRHDDAAATFAADATVLDDGRTYRGIEEIRNWIGRSSIEFTYTGTRIGQQTPDGTHTTVRVRIDGNFPGGTATLQYRFDHDGRRITHLAITA